MDRHFCCFGLVLTLTLVTFVGEAVREAFDPRNFQHTNRYENEKYLPGFFVLVNVYWFQGCDNPQLKPPRTDGSGQENSSHDENRKIDREFARELAREFGREFAREFARQMKNNLSHEDIDFSMDKNDC